MKKQVISISSLETGGPYNLCIRYGDLIFISGLLPYDAEFSARLREARTLGAASPRFPNLPFDRQVEIVMENLRTIVQAAGSNMGSLLKVNVWLKDQGQQNAFDRIYRRYFSAQDSLPARTRIQAGRIPTDCDVEVEAIGYVPN